MLGKTISGAVQLSRTVAASYFKHFGLLWRIMMPVVIVVIVVDIGLFFYNHTRFEKFAEENKFEVHWTANTVRGIEPTVSPRPKLESERSWIWIFSTNDFIFTGDDDSSWRWNFTFRHFEYSLLLLTLCPLAFAVAQLSRYPKMIARDAWRQTRTKFWSVLGANLLLILIHEAIHLLMYSVTFQFIHISSVMMNIIPMGDTVVMFFLRIITIVPMCYILVTFSLYNPCLMLEKQSVISVFRRSHALVKGVRWRFFLIYMVTSWVASIITSIFLGCTFLAFSIFIPEVAPVRDALLQFRFFTLFLGANAAVILEAFPSVWAKVPIIVVRGLILTFLVPIWAILTTHLYMVRVDGLSS